MPSVFHGRLIRPTSHRRAPFWAVLGLAVALGAPGLLQAQTGEVLTVKRAADLRSGPGESNAAVGSLAAQAQVSRLAGRQGPWVEVKDATGRTGWLHMFDVAGTSAGGGGNTASSALRGITSFFTRGGTPNTATGTSTVGIRGLRAQDLAAAQPNANAVLMMETLRIDPGQARGYAAESQWQAQTVEALPVPPPPNQPTGGDNNRDRF